MSCVRETYEDMESNVSIRPFTHLSVCHIEFSSLEKKSYLAFQNNFNYFKMRVRAKRSWRKQTSTHLQTKTASASPVTPHILSQFKSLINYESQTDWAEGTTWERKTQMNTCIRYDPLSTHISNCLAGRGGERRFRKREDIGQGEG